MAEAHRSPPSGQQPQRRPRTSHPRRGRPSKGASAALYALFVIGLSAVLATLGWVWANDLLALNTWLRTQTGSDNAVLRTLMTAKRSWMDANGVTGYDLEGEAP